MLTTIKNLLAKLRSAVTSSESASAAAEGLDKWQRHMRNQVLRRREAKQQKQPRRKAKHVKAKASARRPPPFRRARHRGDRRFFFFAFSLAKSPHVHVVPGGHFSDPVGDAEMGSFLCVCMYVSFVWWFWVGASLVRSGRSLQTSLVPVSKGGFLKFSEVDKAEKESIFSLVNHEPPPPPPHAAIFCPHSATISALFSPVEGELSVFLLAVPNGKACETCWWARHAWFCAARESLSADLFYSL
ncbi:hypothetical protein BKA81DRAFT_417600 [Phyllosticta paracitricarpa]